MLKKDITIKAIIEIVGSPKEHVEKTINLIIDKLKERKEIEVLNHEIAEAKQVKQFWSSFIELNLKFDKFDVLLGFCFDFMPSSIELISPNKMDFENMDFNNFINDILSRIHQYDMVLKNMNAQNILMKRELDKKSS